MNIVEIRDFQGTERFSIRRKLGSGGFGIVYEVYDNTRNILVALKILNPNLWKENPQVLYRFKQEFRAIADITHPNLVGLYELIFDGQYWFFTMELVKGVNFLEYVSDRATTSLDNGFDSIDVNAKTVDANAKTQLKAEIKTETEAEIKTQLKAKIKTETETEIETQLKTETEVKTRLKTENELNVFEMHTVAAQELNSDSQLETPIITPPKKSRVNLARLMPALKQLADGVCALHKAGKLHCDIKPSNVLVTEEGRVVLLDFGLIMELSKQQTADSSEIGCTPTHASPEQLSGFAVSKATDWYSVGVMLYEALTGCLPFTGTLLDIIKQKTTYDAPAPSMLVSDIPENLDHLCTELLRHIPERRITEKKIMHHLGLGIISNTLKLPIPDSNKLYLIGREGHLEALQTAFERSKQASASAIFIEGSSGMGKSLLVQSFLSRIETDEKNTLILTGRCYEQESVPFKAFDSLIDSLSQYLRNLSVNTELIPKDIQALARLFPVLRQVKWIDAAKVLEIPDSQELRRRAFTAFRELFTKLASDKSIVLFIDDLQWGDLDSAALLDEILHLPESSKFLLIASYRSEDKKNSTILQALSELRTKNINLQIQDLVVDKLPAEESRILINSLMMYQQDLGLATETIIRESGGNPFFINQLVQYSQTQKIQQQEDDTQDVEEMFSRQVKLDNLIWIRIRQLPEEARKLLEVVAVAGFPLDLNIARVASEIDIQEQIILNTLRIDRWIRFSGTDEFRRIVTYHDRIRETIVSHLLPEELKATHYKLALALEASSTPDPESLAVHFRAAGHFKKAAECALKAADNATETLAFDHAVKLYRLVKDLQQKEKVDIVDKVVLELKLADALAKVGRGAEAAHIYLEIANSLSVSESRDLRRRAAEQLLFSGHIDKGLEVLQGLLGLFGLGLCKTPVGSIASAVYWRLRLWLHGITFTKRPINEIDPQELFQVDICGLVARGMGLVDPIHGAEYQARYVLMALKAGEIERIIIAIAAEIYYSALTEYGRRQLPKLTNQMKELSEQIDKNSPITNTILANSTLAIGFAAFQQGQWKKAYEVTKEAEAIFRESCIGIVAELHTAQYYSICSLQHMGHWKEVFERLPNLLKESRERSDLYSEIQLAIRYSSALHLAADNPSQALEEVEQSMKRWSQQGFHHQHYLELAAKIQIALYSDEGQGVTAWEHVKNKWSGLTRSMFILIQVVRIEALYLRARSALAAAAKIKDSNPLINEARRAAKKIEKEKMAWGMPYVQLIEAIISAQQSNYTQAITQLTQAEKGLKAGDMQLLAAAAQRRRGSLIGGSQGDLLIAEADNWLTKQQIQNPKALVNMLIPGKWV